MKTNEIRSAFLDFFKSKGHTVLGSDSLVPQNDPTLLFTGAGMNQFKDNFLGVKKDLKRAATSQKCLRTGDLDQVGRTAYHHTFFEMLGNFSFGDYFKRDAIHWAWEFLTRIAGIPEGRLNISVHEKDEEAYEIWLKDIRVPASRIHRLGDKGNFWPSNAPKDGPNGPCGPCSEIYYDQGEDLGLGNEGLGDLDSKRYTEIWNLVFTQFDRQDGGQLIPLAQKNIDTGMGLERLACVLQKKQTNFEIDILAPINEHIESALRVRVPADKRNTLYAITDHIRASVFCIADGVIPSNEGRGYVIRKLLRRALWQAKTLAPGQQIAGPFLHTLTRTVAEIMKAPYPEIADATASIQNTIRSEEERFLTTIESGLLQLDKVFQQLKSSGSKLIPGDRVFELYDTYGFPDELTSRIAETHGYQIDFQAFERLMDEQRKRAKAASQIASSIFVTSDLEKRLASLPATRFTGYTDSHSESSVLLSELEDGKGILVLDQTPCYAESGGQTGDKGIIRGQGFEALITDTQKKDKVFLHLIQVSSGHVQAGDKVKVQLDTTTRSAAMRNHTATHLLHAALRDKFGSAVRQLGSLVSPDKLRFDYSYHKPLSDSEIRDIELTVNQQIWRNTPVSKEEKNTEDAKKDGAIAFFGEKYGDRVRVVSVEGFSKEFCGGTHCDHTGQIGAFLITSESSVASGVRRIEALTGEGALSYLQGTRQKIQEAADILKTSSFDLVSRIQKLQDQVKSLQKNKPQASGELVSPKSILDQSLPAGAVKFAAWCKEGLDLEDLRKISDRLHSDGKQTVYLVATAKDEKIYCLLGMSADMKQTKLDLRDLWRDLASLLQASGGGRKDLIQAGAKNEGQLKSEIWNKVINQAAEKIKAMVP